MKGGVESEELIHIGVDEAETGFCFMGQECLYKSERVENLSVVVCSYRAKGWCH